MDYLDVAAARDLPGLRLVLTAHVPGPWGEAAKAIFAQKGVPYTPVAQQGGGENAELVAWTGLRNAPIAVYGQEPPRAGWYDILMLAERLAPERPLLPLASADRALVVGLSNEICGEWGFGWTRRLLMMRGVPGVPPAASAPPRPFTAEAGARMGAAYGASLGDTTAAATRAAGIVAGLAARLHRQHERGSPYLVGDTVSACDLYWAVFSSMLEPLPHAVNPMPDWMRTVYTDIGPAIAATRDPVLILHRNRIYADYLKLPLDY